MGIESDVKVLATQEGRAVGTAGHEEARRHIIGRLQALSLEPYLPQGFEAEYRYGNQDFCNLLAVLPGVDRSAAPLLLGAHYDAVEGSPGADDNAAAVAVLLEVACRLKRGQLPRSVIFAFFDAEEAPHFLGPSMGSRRFYEDQRLGDIHAAVIMDLVGHDVPLLGLEDLVFVMGMESDEGLGEVIQSCPVDLGIRIMPTLNRYVGDMSDHHIFRVNEVPYLFLSCATWEHYHQYTDTIEKLNYQKAETIARYLAQLTAQISSRPLAGEFEGYDSTSIELGFIRNTMGPALSSMGIPMLPETRQEIGQLVTMMMVQFGL